MDTHTCNINPTQTTPMKFSPKLATLIELAIPYLIFFFSPVMWTLLAVGILVGVDLFTGILAAKKRGEVIRSNGISRTVSKIALYSIAIILSRMMEVVFFPWLPVASITSGYIALVEFKSNLENIGEWTGIDIWNAIKDRITLKKP